MWLRLSTTKIFINGELFRRSQRDQTASASMCIEFQCDGTQWTRHCSTEWLIQVQIHSATSVITKSCLTTTFQSAVFERFIRSQFRTRLNSLRPSQSQVAWPQVTARLRANTNNETNVFHSLFGFSNHLNTVTLVVSYCGTTNVSQL